MNQIIFPEFNLIFNINKIAINIGNIKIYWYAIFIVIGIIISLILCKKDNNKYKIKFETILEISIIALPISILFARMYYVLFKLEYYIKNPAEILLIKDGGLAIYGGIIGGIIVIYFYTKKKKINILDVLDYIAPYLALSQSIGRWGNFFNIEAYGTKTKNILRMGIIENGRYIEVHPTFLYESICDGLIFIILYLLRNKRKYKGQITYVYLLLYSLIRFIIEPLRADSLMLGNIRVSQILSLILFIIIIIRMLPYVSKLKHK